MPEPLEFITLSDVQNIIAKLRPSDRASLRPWVIAKYGASGELLSALEPENMPRVEHRLRRHVEEGVV